MASPPPRRIMGLDPGLRSTGWGVVAVTGNKLNFIASGVAQSKASDDLATRLVTLETEIAAAIATFAPDEVAVENSFVNKDPVASLKLGHARAICLLVPARLGLSVHEYAPNAVKKTVTGSGHADKKQIMTMIKMLLPAATPEGDHDADALAIAITHAYQARARSLADLGVA